MEIFKQFELDVWYKVSTYIGGILFILSFFQKSVLLSNDKLVFLSAGLIFVGLAEWKNAHDEISFKPANAYTGPAAYLTIPTRVETPLGTLFWFLAGMSFGAFFVLFFK